MSKRIVLRDFVIVADAESGRWAGSRADRRDGRRKSILIDALQLVLGRAPTPAACAKAQRADQRRVRRCRRCTPWLGGGRLRWPPELLLRRTIDTGNAAAPGSTAVRATAGADAALGERLVDIHGQHAWQSLTPADAVRVVCSTPTRRSMRAHGAAWRRWRDADQAPQTAGARRTPAASANAWPGRSARSNAGTGGRMARAEHAPRAARRRRCSMRRTHRSKRRRMASPGVDAVDRRAVGPCRRSGATTLSFAALFEDCSRAASNWPTAALCLRLPGRTTRSPGLARAGRPHGPVARLARPLKRPGRTAPGLGRLEGELARLDAATSMPLRHRGSRPAPTTGAGAQAVAPPRGGARCRRTHQRGHAGPGHGGGRFGGAPALRPAAAARPGGCAASWSRAAPAAARPVAKVASGGELSRIALAIAVTTSQHGQAGTLICSTRSMRASAARVAQVVGQLMRRLGQDRQVWRSPTPRSPPARTTTWW